MTDESTVRVALARVVAHREFAPEELRWHCDPTAFDFQTTDELPEVDRILGQDRAMKALTLGLEMESPGFNIFACGLAGTGKTTAVKRCLAAIDRSERQPTDKCYAVNFRDPHRPVALILPAGEGRAFKNDMGQVVEDLRREVPRLFESKVYEEGRESVVGEATERERTLVRALDQAVSAAGFALVEVEVGSGRHPRVVYMVGEEPVDLDDLPEKDPTVSEERLEELRQLHRELSAQLQATVKQTRQLARQVQNRLESLKRHFVADIIDLHVGEIRERYDYPKVARFLDQVVEHVLEHLEAFEGSAEVPVEFFNVYDVNVIVDHTESRGAPVVIETAPNAASLFGSIERIVDERGQVRADFMSIKSGALLEADGGYLVFNMNDAANDPEVWPLLKRTLKNGLLTIQSQESLWGGASVVLKPEPIPVAVKVIVVGDPDMYHALYELDDDFRKIFKVKAEFDSVMPRDAGAVKSTAQFVRSICQKEGLLPFDRSGVAALVEEAVRMTGRRDKLSTRFSDVADVARESAYWARKARASQVNGTHVERAVRERLGRVGLIEEKVQEMFSDGSLLMSVEGAQVGVVNGLTYLDAGDHGFGQPIRLTAVTSMGRAGLVNIEREVELSGKAHSKGVLIIEGFLRQRYAQDKPLSMSASITFEQSYASVDGDSASSTEIYAILSSLSGVPLTQALAVTGSVNQNGEVQPIGSANEKIEGFFRVCRSRGLTGDQGCLIPELNAVDLMLSNEVVEAVAAGMFHIYPVRTIDQGLEILTGVAAGVRGPDGEFPVGTVNRAVDDRLIELAEGLREFGEGGEDGDDAEEGGD